MMRFKDRYEFHLDNKQLLVLFLGLLLLEVFVFLMGYFAGQGVPAERMARNTPSETALPQETIVEGQVASVPEQKRETYTFHETLTADSAPVDFEPAAKEPANELVAALDTAAEIPAPEPKPEVKPAPRPAEPVAPKPAVKPAPIAKPAAAGKFVIQVSSTSDEARAVELMARLKKHGYPAYYERADLGAKGVWFRVLAGPYATRSEAETVERRMEKKEKVNAYVRTK